ncbi:MAG: helix-turn-helix domain-containing protein [Proteobacteria bacterium]|nr:helix-turn-helix domain-containing protein [Pseudomonadota bacterium]
MKKQKMGHIETSPDKRRIVIKSLLAGESQEGAARAADLSRRTISRWLADPGFTDELEAARTAAFAEALGMLRGGAAFAVKTLLKNLNERNAAERRQAAREILTFAFKGIETLNFEARLTKLEQLIEQGAVGLLRGRRLS